MKNIIALDIGGTSIKSGIVKSNGKFYKNSCKVIKIDSTKDKEYIINKFTSPIKKSINLLNKTNKDFEGIAISICHPFNFRKGISLIQNLVKKQNELVSQIVKDSEALLKEGNQNDAGYKLLQALRGAPKHPRVMKIFQESGTKKLAYQVESEFMRDKKLHEVDEDLYYSIDEKSNVIDLSDKGREFLSPDNPEHFVIPDLGESFHRIEKENTDIVNQIKLKVPVGFQNRVE